MEALVLTILIVINVHVRAIGMVHIAKHSNHPVMMSIVKITVFALIQDTNFGHQTHGNAHVQKDIQEKNVPLTLVRPFHLL
tara:strand:+ start:375 stop:617 length:243 start_codon:yes stop_codon:yes gene_type:complete